MQNSNDTSWDRTNDLPICSRALKPLCYRRSKWQVKLFRREICCVGSGGSIVDTNYCMTYNNNNNNNNNNLSQTIQHITAAREQLAPTEYVKRHDGLAKIIHQKLAEAAELIEDKGPYYKYTPANVLENENFKLYWNRSILTDKTIPFNRPDVTFMNKKTKNIFLIDTAVPNTHIISPKQ